MKPGVTIIHLFLLAAIVVDGKLLHHRRDDTRRHRTLRGLHQPKEEQIQNRGLPKKTSENNNDEDDGELGNGTGAGFVRGIGTVTQSVCPICVCYQPCTIQFNTIIIGNDVNPATLEAVLNAQHDQTGDGPDDTSNLETLLGGGAQNRPPPDAGEVTVPGDALLAEDEDGTTEGTGTSASNSCELACQMQCSHNCGSANGVAASTP